MIFARGFFMNFITLLKSSVFVLGSSYIISKTTRDGFDESEQSVLLEIMIIALILLFAISGRKREFIQNELNEHKRYYRINAVVHFGIMLIAIVFFLLTCIISGWDALDYLFFSMLFFYAGILELIISWIGHSIYAKNK